MFSIKSTNRVFQLYLICIKSLFYIRKLFFFRYNSIILHTMRKPFLLFCTILLTITAANAQDEDYQSYKQEGEFGVGVGLGHYFGDLNTTASLRRPKFSAGVYFLKQFNNYVALKVAGDYAFLGYSDRYSKNSAQFDRNLSFNTSVWEFSVSGQFNFFKFIPGVDGYNYTPYISLGVGVFSYDPFAYLNGQKYYLRPLGTEGQGTAGKPAPYSSMAVCFPLSVGFKYSLNSKVNVFGEVGYRFTTTDYLDDVSTTYAGKDAFPPNPDGTPSVAYQLQDRSLSGIGEKGRQRGNSSQKDAYVLLHVGFSFNIASYVCPTAAK